MPKLSVLEAQRQRLRDELAATSFDSAEYSKCGNVVFRSSRLHRCPCGACPVIEPDCNGRPSVWVIRCQQCDRRVDQEGPFDEVARRWNAGKFSDGSAQISMPLTEIDDNGAISLFRAIIVNGKVKLVK